MDIKKFINETFKIRNKKENHDDHVKFEWNQIDEHIYVGTNSCCQMHFDEDLLKKGIKGNISMEFERLDFAQGLEEFLWLPTKNHTAPTQDNLMIGSKAIEAMIDQGHKIYIHCKNGHGRGPTMAVAYYIYKGKSVDEAIAFVKNGRPETHIKEVQIMALEEFEKSIKK